MKFGIYCVSSTYLAGYIVFSVNQAPVPTAALTDTGAGTIISVSPVRDVNRCPSAALYEETPTAYCRLTPLRYRHQSTQKQHAAMPHGLKHGKEDHHETVFGGYTAFREIRVYR